MSASQTALALFTSAALLSGCGQSVEHADKPQERPDRVAGAGLAQGAPGRERDACALADPAAVRSVFAARRASEDPGPFPGTCSYRLEGGRSSQVYVSDLGPAWTWRRLRSFYAQTRGELRALGLLGEAAFLTQDDRGVEVVVRMRRRIFTVVAANGPDPSIALATAALSRRIAREFPARMPRLASAGTR